MSGTIGGTLAQAGVREVRLRATIVRKDGRREELGTISYWHKNPLRRALWRAARFLRLGA